MPLSLDKIKKAHEGMASVLKPTLLMKSDFLSEDFSADIYIKPENLQRTGAFKIRGAFNKLATLSDDQKQKGIVAASAGNHAQGVALAARLICDSGTSLCPVVTIVMPETTPLIKVENTKRLGARVVLKGDTYDDACLEALRIEREEGAVFVHPFNDYDVIAGQGTIGIEILDELPEADIVIVPVGGGGLISGIAAAIKQVSPNVKVIGVEPEGAACMKAALDACKIVDLEDVNTIADGVAVKTAGDITYKLVKEYVDKIITVTDTEIMEALLLLIEREKLISENAGALSIAALKHVDIKDKKVVSLVSGGNIDVITVSEMLTHGLIARGRLFSFVIELHHKPGELLKVARILAERKANVIQLVHNQFRNPGRFKSVQLEVTVETNGLKHVQEISDTFTKEGYHFEIVQ